MGALIRSSKMIYPVAYGVALAVFLFADMAWLGIIVKRIYRPALGDLLLARVNLGPAAVYYLIYPIGLVLFAIMPAMIGGNVSSALLRGALFGFFTYGTYDLTNQATLRNWSTTLTLADMTWGTLLAAGSSAAAFWVTSAIFGLTE